jgi:hypothetical protein
VKKGAKQMWVKVTTPLKVIDNKCKSADRISLITNFPGIKFRE